MNHFFATLPKTVIAIAAIVAGFGLILVYDPPRTVCDSQMELFHESQKAFLYSAAGGTGFGKKPMVNELYEICKTSNSPGGCFELFDKLKKLSVDLRTIPTQCAQAAAGDTAVKEWVWKNLKLMTQISWGDRSPASNGGKHSWYDASDISLYCDLKENAVRLFGNESFSEWREAQMLGFPQAEKLTRDQVWQKSIFSTSCESFR